MTCRCNPSQPCTCSEYTTPEPVGVIPVTALALTIIMGLYALAKHLIGV